jgi:nucleotide sugar dehydrogenase
MREVLGIICENLIDAPDHHHAEVVKSIENAYRHMEIALANELALAYPDLDVRTVLELVGTKWNVGTFQPSLGVGGYCIPLASHYVIQGAQHPEYLSLLEATVRSSDAQPRRVAEQLVKRDGVKRVGILGLSYTGNVKVWSQSPTLVIMKILKENGIEVQVNDPHYTPEEFKRLCGEDVKTFEFPSDLKEFDTVLIVAAHREYEAVSHSDVLKGLENAKLVLDNVGLWSEIGINDHGIEYHVAGDQNWLGTEGGHGPSFDAKGNGKKDTVGTLTEQKA